MPDLSASVRAAAPLETPSLLLAFAPRLDGELASTQWEASCQTESSFAALRAFTRRRAALWVCVVCVCSAYVCVCHVTRRGWTPERVDLL